MDHRVIKHRAVSEGRIKPALERNNRDNVERIVGVVNDGNFVVQRDNSNYKLNVLLF
jgi:hypothetical protein